ncbi:MAG: NADH-quinone oxidoreductase subunit J family protein [Terriglobales bacterium]
MHPALFFIFGGIAVAGAINLLVQRATIYAALSLVAVMGALAVLFLLLGAEFIAFIQVIVYAGAIMVLFVFVIMLLNADVPEQTRRSRMAQLVGYPVMALLLLELAGVFAATFGGTPLRIGAYLVQVSAVGQALFHQYLLPFEVTSVLFLVGVTGAVLLAARREEPPAGAERPAAQTGVPSRAMADALATPASAMGGVVVEPAPEPARAAAHREGR